MSAHDEPVTDQAAGDRLEDRLPDLIEVLEDSGAAARPHRGGVLTPPPHEDRRPGDTGTANPLHHHRITTTENQGCVCESATSGDGGVVA